MPTYDIRNTIVLCGTARSGTTWLAEVLNTIPDSKILMEPLHLNNVPEIAALGFNWRTTIAPGTDWPEASELFHKILKGELRNDWTLSRTKISQPQNPCHWIVKFIRANRLLRWLTEEFVTRKPILIIRHPCAVVASTLRTAWGKSLDPLAIAKHWCEDYFLPLSTSPPFPWHLVCYENLVRDPEKYFENIFSALGIVSIPDYKPHLRTPSSTTLKGSALAINKDPLSMWRDELSTKLVHDVLAIANDYGIEIYDNSPEPDIERVSMLSQQGLN